MCFLFGWLLVICLFFVLGVVSVYLYVWIMVSSELFYVVDGSIIGVCYVWIFDDMFLVYVVQGFESKIKGIYMCEEFGFLVQINVELLKEYVYFIFV